MKNKKKVDNSNKCDWFNRSSEICKDCKFYSYCRNKVDIKKVQSCSFYPFKSELYICKSCKDAKLCREVSKK